MAQPPMTQASTDLPLLALLESSMDAVIFLDAGQRIRFFNQAAERMFGYASAAIIGQFLDCLIPIQYRNEHQRHVDQFGKTGSSARRMGGEKLLVGLRSDGSQFPIEASISRAEVAGSVTYSAFVRDISERAKAQSQLAAAHAEIKDWARVAQQAREEEKSRIAREIHDELGQLLTALKIDVSQCIDSVSLESVSSKQSSVIQVLQRIRMQLDQTVTATRRIAADLRPLILDDLGLEPALEWLKQEFSARHSAQCVMLFDPELNQLPPELASNVFRIVQEALTNVSKHARASLVHIDIVDEGDIVDITVRDDGIGLDAPSARPNPDAAGKRGLLGIRERAYALGGTLEIDSQIGSGTRLNVRLPKPVLQLQSASAALAACPASTSAKDVLKENSP